MTYPSPTSSPKQLTFDASIVISGIPVMFATSAGLTHPLTNITNPPVSLTSVAAFKPDDLELGTSSLDYDTLTQQPASVRSKIAIAPAFSSYFERRRTPQPTLTTLVTEASVTWTLSSTTGISIGTVLYCNRESVLVTAVAAPNVTVTRNYCAFPGDKAAVHQAGAIVSLVPRHWLGRNAELRYWNARTDSYLVKYLRFSSSPTPSRNDGKWALEADDGLRAFDKNIAVGFSGSAVDAISGYNSGSGATMLVFSLITPRENTREFATCPSGNQGHLLLKTSDEGAVMAIDSVLAGVPYVETTASSWSYLLSALGPSFGTTVAGGNTEVFEDDMSMRRVYVFTGPPMVAAMQVLLSDGGNGQNHATYDALFGLTSSAATAAMRVEANERECRFGAAIPAALIDIPSDTSEVMTYRSPGWCRVLGANGPESLLEFLEDVAWHCRGYWRLNADQKLSFKTFDADWSTDTVAATIDASVIGRNTELVSIDDEKDILHSLTIECNHSAISDKFHLTVSANFGETAETYRDCAGTIKIQRRSLICSLPSGGSPSILRDVPAIPADLDTVRLELDRIFARRAYDTRRYRVEVPWHFHTLEVGDKVRLTFDQFNAFDGSTVSGMGCEVTAITREHMRGAVILDLHELFSDTTFIAPVGEAASWAGSVVTLSTTSKFGGGTNPENYFAVGWPVVLLRGSGVTPLYSSVSGALAISVINTGTRAITLTGVLPGWQAAGDLLVCPAWDSATSTVVNAAQGLYQQNYAFMGDATGALGSLDVAGKVWA